MLVVHSGVSRRRLHGAAGREGGDGDRAVLGCQGSGNGIWGWRGEGLKWKEEEKEGCSDREREMHLVFPLFFGRGYFGKMVSWRMEKEKR